MTPSPATTFVRGWVALYTRGLTPEARHARRTEIEGDLWSHAQDAFERGRGPTSLEVDMITRLILGMPDDIEWRRAHRGVAGPLQTKETMMREPRSHHVLTVIGAVLAAIGLAFAVLSLVVIQRNTSDAPSDVWAASAGAAAMMAGLTLALIGLLIVRRNPMVARQMAIVGGAVIGGATLMVFAWAWPIGVAMALPAVIGFVRARQVMAAQGPLPA
ncbi:MAG: hypothetical protein ABIQ58_08325 [Candidatus Limnocylindrales bacterium]